MSTVNGPDAPMSVQTMRCTPADIDLVVDEAVVDAVGDGAVVVQEANTDDRFEDVVDAADVEVCLLLAGERRIRQVLRGGTGPHRPRHLVRVGVGGHQLVVAGADIALECLGNGWSRISRRICSPRRARFGDVLDVEAGESIADLGIQSTFGEKVPVGIRRSWQKPPGTRTPASARLTTISPSEAFLPPTCGTSDVPISVNQRIVDIRKPFEWCAGRVSGDAASSS